MKTYDEVIQLLGLQMVERVREGVANLYASPSDFSCGMVAYIFETDIGDVRADLLERAACMLGVDIE